MEIHSDGHIVCNFYSFGLAGSSFSAAKLDQTKSLNDTFVSCVFPGLVCDAKKKKERVSVAHLGPISMEPCGAVSQTRKRSQDHCQKLDFIVSLPLDLFLHLSAPLTATAGSNFLQMSYFIAGATEQALSLCVSLLSFSPPPCLPAQRQKIAAVRTN